MKRTNCMIALGIAIAMLPGCARQEKYASPPDDRSATQSIESSTPNISQQEEPSGQPYSDGGAEPAVGQVIVEPVLIADGLYDMGRTLFPDSDVWMSGRLLSGDRLLAWTMQEQSILYNHRTGEILHQVPERVEPLGMEHFYTTKQNGEGSYTMILYDSDLQILAQHEADRPAFPATDGVTLLYDQRQITTYNTETCMEAMFHLREVDTEYQGEIYVYAFDGEWVFFSTTCNPMPGNPGIGAYNVLSGETHFQNDFPVAFSGVPECFGEHKALYWQDGSAYGTDGTFCMVIDASAGEISRLDVGANACRMSDNGQFLAVVDSQWDPTLSQIRLTEIRTFVGDTLEPLTKRSLSLPVYSDYGSSFGRISVSEDGRTLCFTGLLEEEAGTRQTLFLFQVDAG